MNGSNVRARRLPRVALASAEEYDQPWSRSRRVKIFFISAGLVLALGLGWTILQPVVYRSNATVLMSAPTPIDAEAATENVQNVAIQGKILLGGEITERILARMNDDFGMNLDYLYLARTLRVEPVSGTNLIEMVAEGAERNLLASLVNNWIDVYLDARARDIQSNKQNSMRMVQDELDGLAVKLEASRDALEQYREKNNIVSVEREENDVMSRLDGLNAALKRALEEEVKTKVYLETVRNAVNSGTPVIPKSDAGQFRNLQNELLQLQARMSELTKRYTIDYIQKQPKLRAIPERIETLEKQISEELSEGGRLELLSAQQEYTTAHLAVQEIQQRLNDHKEEVAKFNRIYATHKALEEDLSRLEALNRDAQARLVQMEVRRVEKYPQVSVVERPALMPLRVGPDYILLVGATFLIALIVGILAVWLYGYLAPRRQQPTYVTLSGLHLYPQEMAGALAHNGESDARLSGSPVARLESDGRNQEKNDTSPGDQR